MTYPYQTILATRESAQVERCHTIPHIGSYTVGAHCYGALALLLLLHESPSLPLVKAVAFHDLPERWTGDMPSTGKTGASRAALEATEEAIFKKLGLQFDLTADEKKWVRLVDTLDLWLWSWEQEVLGSRACREILLRCQSWLTVNAPVGRVSDFVQRYLAEGSARLSSDFSEVKVDR